jgi:serine/threonine-protein kinase Chk1
MDSDSSRIDNYEVIRTLGKGFTSKVKLARNIESGELVAIKIVRPEKLSTFRVELSVLQKVTEHPNIIKLLDYKTSSEYIKPSGKSKPISYLALELGKNGEIFDYISKLGPFPEPIARKCFVELISAIEALHESGIVHRDLKPENIFFNERYELKLADFGYCGPAEGRDGSGQLSSFKGTRAYMAPEILERRLYQGRATDLFSSGIILFILVFARPPFMKAERINPHYINIVNKNWDRFWRIHNIPNSPQIPQTCKDLLEKLLTYDPSERITLGELKEHAWFKGPTATQDEAEKFLSPASTPSEQAYEKSSNQKGFRCPFSDEEITLSRESSRNLVLNDLNLVGTTKFLIKGSPDTLFEGIQRFLSEKGSLKINPLEYFLKFSNESFTAHFSMSRSGDKYLIQAKRISGDHWKFYEIFQELYNA